MKEQSQIDDMRAAIQGDRERAEQARQRSTENVRALIEPAVEDSAPEPAAGAGTGAEPVRATLRALAPDRYAQIVERRERERIMRQGVVLPETPRDRRNLDGLEQDVRDSPLKGRALPLRLRNFRPDAGSYLASLGGPRPVHGEAA